MTPGNGQYAIDLLQQLITDAREDLPDYRRLLDFLAVLTAKLVAISWKDAADRPEGW